MKFLIYQYFSKEKHKKMNSIPSDEAWIDFQTNIDNNLKDLGFKDFHELSIQSLKAYANKIGVDYILYDTLDETINYNPYYGRFYPFKNDLVNDYDAVCYFDCDILVTKHAGNIFDYHNPNSITLYSRPISVRENLNRLRDKKIVRNKRDTTGIIIVPKSVFSDFKNINLEVFDTDDTYQLVVDEIILFRYLKNNPVSQLPHSYNYLMHQIERTDKKSIDARFDMNFIHYGLDYKDMLYKDFSSEAILK